MEANIIHRCAGNAKRNIIQIEKKDIGSKVLVLNHYKSGWSLVIFMGKEGHMPSNCLKLKPCPSFKGLLNSNESSILLLNKEAYTCFVFFKPGNSNYFLKVKTSKGEQIELVITRDPDNYFSISNSSSFVSVNSMCHELLNKKGDSYQVNMNNLFTIKQLESMKDYIDESELVKDKLLVDIEKLDLNYLEPSKLSEIEKELKCEGFYVHRNENKDSILKEFDIINKEKLEQHKIKEEEKKVETYQKMISFNRDQLDNMSNNDVNILYKLEEKYIEDIAEYKTDNMFSELFERDEISKLTNISVDGPFENSTVDFVYDLLTKKHPSKSQKFISLVLVPTLLVRIYSRKFNYSDSESIKNIQQTKLRDSDDYVTECDKCGMILSSNIELRTHNPCNKKKKKNIFRNHHEEPMEKKFKFDQIIHESVNNIVKEDLDCHLCSLPLNENMFNQVISTCISFTVGARWTEIEKCKCLKSVHVACGRSFFCNNKIL